MHVEARGALVINRPATSLASQDRLLLAARMKEAELPWPATVSAGGGIPGEREVLAKWTFPVIVKSQHSRFGDLVVKANGPQQLLQLMLNREQGPFVLQEFVRSDGSDVKLWVIAQQVFAALRPSPLEANAGRENFVIPARRIPDEWRSIALKVGKVLDLQLYGVDLLVSGRGPVVIDVNSFPGFRCVPGAEAALLATIERLGSQTAAT